MSSAHDDLLRRADSHLEFVSTIYNKEHLALIRDLRDALVAASTLPDAVRADIRLMTRSVGKHSLDDNALDAADRLDAFLAAHQPLERASEQPATSRADVSSTSLADRGSSESALRAKIKRVRTVRDKWEYTKFGIDATDIVCDLDAAMCDKPHDDPIYVCHACGFNPQAEAARTTEETP